MTAEEIYGYVPDLLGPLDYGKLRKGLKDELAKFLGEVQDPAVAKSITDIFNKLDAQLDITLSALRDALRGAGNKNFTTLEADVESVLGQLNVLLSTRASESTLSTILARLDITTSALRDALRGAGTRDFTTLEADVEALDVRLRPINKDFVFNTAVVANTDIFGAALTPTSSPTVFRIYAAFDAAGILIVRRTRGVVTVSEQLNGGTALTANAAYMFDVLVRAGDSVNLQYSVNATALNLHMIEVPGVIS